MKRLFTLFFSALFISLTVNIPVSYTQPKFYVNITGGYTAPLADLKGSLPDTLFQSGTYIDFGKTGNYGFSTGYNINLMGKMGLDSTGKFNITGGLIYNSFTTRVSFPRSSGIDLSYKDKLNIITLAAGFEYMLTPRKRFSLFGGVEFTANFFSGKIEASGDTAYWQYRVNESRYGAQFNLGGDYKINKSFGIIAGIKMSFSNMIGKSRNQTVTQNSVNDAENNPVALDTEVPLNDGSDGSTKTKSISMLQIYTGLSYYFGYPLKYKH